MNIPPSFKHSLKSVRYQGRRWAVALRYGAGTLDKLPAVLGNAMPKSGSHLIIQVLQGLTRIGPFVNPGYPPVNRGEDNRKLSDQQVLENILRMQPGEISYGYISAKEPFLSVLTQSGRATIFVYRDPRDMIISHIFYATQMHAGHWMHSYYTEKLNSMEARIQAAIQGVEEPGSELTPIRQRYEGYLGWLEQPQVLSLRFEELILERELAFGKLLEYFAGFGFRSRLPREEAIAILQEAIAPRKSGTFRKGKPGNWREHFTPDNIATFKAATGDLLVRLGYETSLDW
ncbi:MAG TPA: sulfotransferase domain-containing protein [Anaerolineales bacterium]|nr:sulfotransferase domain-containing protein [Anaerolineales bacterium]